MTGLATDLPEFAVNLTQPLLFKTIIKKLAPSF